MGGVAPVETSTTYIEKDLQDYCTHYYSLLQVNLHDPKMYYGQTGKVALEL